MTLTIFILLFALFAAAIHLYLLNPDEIILNLTQNISVDISAATLILCSIALGLAAALLIAGYKKFFDLFSDFFSKLREREKRRFKDNFKSGLRCFFNERFKEAETFFRKVISKNPKHTRSLFFLGKIADKRGDVFDSIKFHTKVRELDRVDIENLYSLAGEFEKADKLGDALETLKEIVKIENKSSKPLIAMREIYFKRGELEKAINIQGDLCNIVDSDKCARENERLSWLKYLLAIDKAKQNDFDNCFSILKEIMKRDKNFIPSYVKSSEIFLTMEKEKEAINILETGYKNTKAHIILRLLIDLYQSKNSDGKVVETIKWAMEKNPEAPYLKIVLAEFYIRKGMNNEAIELLEGSKKDLSSALALHLILGIAYDKVNKSEESKKEYNMAFKAGTKDIVFYYCSFCGKRELDWADRCLECGEFNPFTASAVIGV